MVGIVDYSQVTAATWAYVKPQMANSAFDKTTACNWMRKRGAIRIMGGEQAEFLTELGGPAVHGHMTRGQQLNLDSQKILDKSKYQWREHGVILRVEHLDLEANRGKYAQVNLLEAIRKNGMSAAGDDLERAFFGVKEDDTLVGTDTKYPVDVYTLAQKTTGAVGGLNPTTWPRWKPGYSSDKGATRPSESDITEMLVKTQSKVGGMPKVVFCDTQAYLDLYRVVRERRRQNNAMMADLGYQGFTFEGTDFLHVPHPAMPRGLGLDGSGDPTKGFVYLAIDPEHLFIVTHSRRFMRPSDRIPVAGTFADIYHIETQYCFATDNREVQGCLYANTNATAA